MSILVKDVVSNSDLANASFKFTLEGYMFNGTTDDQGLAVIPSFPLSPGDTPSATVVVSKAGYVTKARNVIIQGGSQQINFYLFPLTAALLMCADGYFFHY